MSFASSANSKRKLPMNVRDIRAMLKNRARRAEIYCTAEYWDSKAESYSDASVSMWPNNNLNGHYQRERLEWLNRHTGDVSGKRLLDAGCGFGSLSKHYAALGARVVGFDFSARSIALARKSNVGDNPEFRVQSIFDLNDRACYDVIVVWGVLTIACRDRSELLDALCRLRAALAPGGKLLLMEPIHSGFLHRVLRMGVEEFIGVMEEAGLGIEDVTHLHFWPARIALAYVPLPRAITTVGYHCGQLILRLLGRKAMGDYTAIHASFAGSPTC